MKVNEPLRMIPEVVPNHRTHFRPIYVRVRGLETSADVFVLVPVPKRPQRMGRVQTAGSQREARVNSFSRNDAVGREVIAKQMLAQAEE